MDVEMEVVHCANCNVTFAVTSDMANRRRHDHKSFYCPNGHSNYFPDKTDEEKLKEKLSEKDKELQIREKELIEARESAAELRDTRNNFISKFFNEQFQKGKTSLLLKDVAPVFGMKARELKDHIEIFMPGFKCARSGKGYLVLKIEKEKK